jgi:catechol 2,3-dioxygenase-like lactoylglutathione lyase family enzyme
MPLSSYRVGAAVAVSDMNRAKAFYEDILGLTAWGDDPDGGRTYLCAEHSTIHVFPSPGHAGGSGATAAGWTVGDLEAVVDELTANGIEFERYEGPQITTDENGIATVGDGKGAWFKDPDGNILGLIQA